MVFFNFSTYNSKSGDFVFTTRVPFLHSTMFQYSHGTTPLRQSERAYYLSYFIIYGVRYLIFLLNVDIIDPVSFQIQHMCLEKEFETLDKTQAVTPTMLTPEATHRALVKIGALQSYTIVEMYPSFYSYIRGDEL